MIRLGSADDGRSVPVAPGDVVELTLDEPSGGGYLWSFEVPDGLRPVEEGRHATPAAAPGAIGRRSLRLEVAEPGLHVLRARLGRPWEATPVRELAVELDAR